MELSRRTGLAKTTLTSMLDRMERNGHILREFDKKDRRQIRIRLTEKARSMEKRYAEVSQKMNRLFYEGFSHEEIVNFEDQLMRILNNLEKEEAK